MLSFEDYESKGWWAEWNPRICTNYIGYATYATQCQQMAQSRGYNTYCMGTGPAWSGG